jgi:hypothetical protein
MDPVSKVLRFNFCILKHWTIDKVIKHGSPTRGLPGCIMQTMATFVNYIYTTKITE